MKTYLITVQATVRATAEDDVALDRVKAVVMQSIRDEGLFVVDRVVASREFTESDTLLLFAETLGTVN